MRDDWTLQNLPFLVEFGESSRMRTKPKILVVEDQESILALMLFALRQAGFEVVAAQTAVEGLRIDHEDPVDLIALDFDLQDASQ
jgi:DNA-binding NtrC family response regulator